MSVRIDDGIVFHPNFRRCAPEAFALFIAGLCYCHRYQTGGLIPKDDVPHLLPALPPPRAMELAGELAANGPEPSWLDEGTHFRVHDAALLHSDRQQAARREQNAERQRRFRERRAGRDVTRYVTGDVTRDMTRDVTGYVTRDVTRDAPLPGPLPPTPTLPIEKERSISKSGSISLSQSAPARGVTRDVTRYVTRDSRGAVTGESQPGGTSEPQPAAAVTGKPQPDAVAGKPLPSPAAGGPQPDAPTRDAPRDTAPAAPPPPDDAFAAWFAAYPRQQGEIPARRAWAAAGSALPPLPELLASLELQKAGAQWQNPQFIPLPERYLREERWRDRPSPPAKPAYRSPAAELRAMGSDEGRREALRRISEAARFDPFDDFPGEKGPRA